MTREEAISIMNVIIHMLEAQYDTDRIEDAVEMAIKALEQEPKTGHWIISPNDCFVHCSECGLHGDKGIYKHYGWCPNCGCRMFEPQEGSE